MILGGTVALHYLAFGVIMSCVENDEARKVALEYLSDAIGKFLPAEVGLVGAATAFYFSSQQAGRSKFDRG